MGGLQWLDEFRFRQQRADLAGGLSLKVKALLSALDGLEVMSGGGVHAHRGTQALAIDVGHALGDAGERHQPHPHQLLLQLLVLQPMLNTMKAL